MLDIEEFQLWMEYASRLAHEPNPLTGSPALRDDVRFAFLASTVSGMFSGKPVDAAKFLRALDSSTEPRPKAVRAADPAASWQRFKSSVRAYGEAVKGR